MVSARGRICLNASCGELEFRRPDRGFRPSLRRRRQAHFRYRLATSSYGFSVGAFALAEELHSWIVSSLSLSSSVENDVSREYAVLLENVNHHGGHGSNAGPVCRPS
jgi:hypothetical protein